MLPRLLHQLGPHLQKLCIYIIRCSTFGTLLRLAGLLLPSGQHSAGSKHQAAVTAQVPLAASLADKCLTLSLCQEPRCAGPYPLRMLQD